MNTELEKRLKEIEAEDVVLGIFILLIILTYIANQAERSYFLGGGERDKKTYYNTMIFVFLVVVLINLYYIKLGYDGVKSLSPNDSYQKQKYAKLTLTAGLVALVASLIILYIAVTDTDIDAEISL